jgi:uncharacterized protein
MTPASLTEEDKQVLLHLARQALEVVLQGQDLPELDLDKLSDPLKNPGAVFVTLTNRGTLRGCIGTLEPHMPLVEDVRQRSIAAALSDYRFPPVCEEELADLTIEISYLTCPQPLEYQDPEDLLHLVQPFVHGVVIRDGERRATFLPQVWEKLPDVESFLNHLCQKMGEAPDLWRCRPLKVWIYQVEKFSE